MRHTDSLLLVWRLAELEAINLRSEQNETGLSAQRIYQDLVEENGFSDSYQLSNACPQATSAATETDLALECQPGREVRLAFGISV
jgi:hypothetical protein